MTAGVKRFRDGGQIAILGAGSMGRLWAALLPSSHCGFLPRLSGNTSELELGGNFSRQEGLPETRCEYVLVRSAPPSMAAQGFGKAGLTASPSAGDARTSVRLPWLHSAAGVELLLVTTKAGDTLPALEGWLPHIAEDTPIVLFQNGLGSQQAVAERWPDRPILAASSTEGANRPEPDVLVHAGVGDTWVGPLTDSASATTESVVQRLAQSGLQVHAENSIVPRLWQKLMVNAGINAFTALLDCPNGAIVDAPLYRQTIDGLCTEITALLQADTGERATPQALRERIEAIAKSTARNTSSMRADANAGRKTEIDFINGYLVQCGQRHGIATPVNQMLVQRVKSL
ncbi:2-dehydropantoate 2-reductase [Marinobacter sp. M3C]|uniref:ketopantoate reductase family protein n=2 Tax=unclassified Marinobacter TaxID=83889 RepID=UPI00200F021C|nr:MULTISPECIES: 2-dehydropantoate 2-reductase [unclassified Marinobacter]MCL1481675.1 2-dehydropantoate 2-reductase [Marinobacter sp.]MCL1483518.1 2-dehydropantoate 2-reductase [Marinobacter sp.]UQG61222.1 2-dehydropantoate 2-reductase [Marinobacter sp. M3C]UQG70697.1 2-dehydropantoate 2-reductase [Marinobacter sp. M1C]